MTAVASWLPDIGEIVWLDYETSKGKEMSGQHPFLVLSSKAFNDRTKTIVGLAMTSKEHMTSGRHDFNPFQIKNVTSKGEESYINTNQIHTFDWEIRKMKKHPWGKVNSIVLDRCKEYVASILGI